MSKGKTALHLVTDNEGISPLTFEKAHHVTDILTYGRERVSKLIPAFHDTGECPSTRLAILRAILSHPEAMEDPKFKDLIATARQDESFAIRMIAATQEERLSKN